MQIQTQKVLNFSLKLYITKINLLNYFLGRCVVAMDWNPANSDILAVGYGKFLFSEETKKGIVMIWNIKNPVQPERHYNFNSPITSLQFSRQCANVLAIGININTETQLKQLLSSL